MSDATPRPAEISIDTALIEKWFAIDPHSMVEISLPRFALDLLYVAIEKPYFATSNVVAMVTADAAGDAATRDEALEHLKDHVVAGINALRQFQSLVMASAAGVTLDNNWQMRPEGDQ